MSGKLTLVVCNDKTKFKVTEKAMRPARDKRQCFYCQEPIGGMHKPDCVLISKKVNINLSITYEKSVPNYWNEEMINDFLNEGSLCANSVIDDLMSNFCAEDKPCMCGLALFEYVGGDSKPYKKE